MKWDAALYKSNHEFVAHYGKALLDYLPRDTNYTVLDLGCGTGLLTKKLSEMYRNVIGVDSSEEMIHHCQQTYPELHFQVMNACQLIWRDSFDVVFSNAVFHWLQDQDSLLNNVHKVLKSDGILLCEFGCYGNISIIQKAFSSAMLLYNINYINPFYFPTVKEYEQKLQSHGFRIKEIFDFSRPTPLEAGNKGLYHWVRQFFAQELSVFSPSQQSSILKAMEEDLRHTLWDGEQWIADYKRIRVVAHKIC